MNTNLAVTKTQKAMSLKAYISGDKIKKQLMEAVPQWFSVDRLLRVAFSSMLANPKLLDCTPESILNSLMRCAQLGLEPILGRAHLVPYTNNRKKPPVVEMQFQAGYQGLVDLARRSGEIVDVKPYVVYAKDFFDMELGDTDTITHKPFVGPKKERGKPIGGYVIWYFKSGHKSKHWMPIDEIYDEHRAKSQAYNGAIKYKRTDTPWIENEGSMICKTLIKASSKLMPASIDFMEAVHLDTISESGESQASYNLDFGDISVASDVPEEIEFETEVETDEGPNELTVNFEKWISEVAEQNDITLDGAWKFVKINAGHFDKTKDEIVQSALTNKERFLEALKDYGKEEEAPDIRNEYNNLRRKGFRPWLEALGREKYNDLSPEIQKELQDKWLAMGTKGYEEYAVAFPYNEPPAREADVILVGQEVDLENPEEDQDENPSEEEGISGPQFQKDMLFYMKELRAEFWPILDAKGYKGAVDVPEEERENLLRILKSKLDEINNGGE